MPPSPSCIVGCTCTSSSFALFRVWLLDALCDITVPLCFFAKPLASVCKSTDDLTRSAKERGDFCGLLVFGSIGPCCDGREIVGAPSPLIFSVADGDGCEATDDEPSDVALPTAE